MCEEVEYDEVYLHSHGVTVYAKHTLSIVCPLTFRYRGWALIGVGPIEKRVTPSSSSSIVVFIMMVVFSGKVLHIRFIISAADRSIGSTTGFNNHGEGPY